MQTLVTAKCKAGVPAALNIGKHQQCLREKKNSQVIETKSSPSNNWQTNLVNLYSLLRNLLVLVSFVPGHTRIAYFCSCVQSGTHNCKNGVMRHEPIERLTHSFNTNSRHSGIQQADGCSIVRGFDNPKVR